MPNLLPRIAGLAFSMACVAGSAVAGVTAVASSSLAALYMCDGCSPGPVDLLEAGGVRSDIRLASSAIVPASGNDTVLAPASPTVFGAVVQAYDSASVSIGASSTATSNGVIPVVGTSLGQVDAAKRWQISTGSLDVGIASLSQGDFLGYNSISNGGDIFESPQFALTTPVPEPSTWAMMIMGTGILGCALRRRRVAAVAEVGMR